MTSTDTYNVSVAELSDEILNYVVPEEKDWLISEGLLTFPNKERTLREMKESMESVEELYDTVKEYNIQGEELAQIEKDREDLYSFYNENNPEELIRKTKENGEYYLYYNILKFRVNQKIEEIKDIDNERIPKLIELYENLVTAVDHILSMSYFEFDEEQAKEIESKYKKKSHNALKQLALTNIRESGYTEKVNLGKSLKEFNFNSEQRIVIQKAFYVLCIESKVNKYLYEVSKDFIEKITYFPTSKVEEMKEYVKEIQLKLEEVYENYKEIL